MCGDVPVRDAECFAERAHIECIMLDACGACARWSLRVAASALIVEDDLALLGERGEGRPEEVVAVDHAAVDGEQRCRAGDVRGAAHGEVEAACLYALAGERRGAGTRASPRGEAVARCERGLRFVRRVRCG